MVNLYSIEDLLVGKYYRSRSVQGEIRHAEIDNRAVWYGENTQSYLIEIFPDKGHQAVWRTLAVKLGE